MSGVIFTDTLAQALVLSRACHLWQRAHVAGYSAVRWDIPKRRLRDGKFCIQVDPRVLAALAPNLLARIERLAEEEALEAEQPQADEAIG